MQVEEAQSCASASLSRVPASPWSGYVPTGARLPETIGVACVSEEQLEANGGLVLFFPDRPEPGQTGQPIFAFGDGVEQMVTHVEGTISRAFSRMMSLEERQPIRPGTHLEVTRDKVHYLQCLRNTPLAGITAQRHSEFVFAWAMLGCYAREIAWKTACPLDSLLRSHVQPTPSAPAFCRRDNCYAVSVLGGCLFLAGAGCRYGFRFPAIRGAAKPSTSVPAGAESMCLCQRHDGSEQSCSGRCNWQHIACSQLVWPLGPGDGDACGPECQANTLRKHQTALAAVNSW